MFDFDSGKLLIIGIIALVVIGPKELPGVLRQVGQMVSRMRRMANDFQGQFMEAMREAELDDLKKDVTMMAGIGDLSAYNPLASVSAELNATRTEVEAALRNETAVPAHPALAEGAPLLTDQPAISVDAAAPALPAEIVREPASAHAVKSGDAA